MTLFWYLTLVIVLLIWGAIRIWVANKRTKVFNHREFYKIRENLVRVKNTILFKYFLNKYLKDFYKVGKEKWYHDTYTIFEKKSNKPVVKWEIYTNNLYSWEQANILLDKIREEQAESLRRKRKEVLKNHLSPFFEEDDKILYK